MSARPRIYACIAVLATCAALALAAPGAHATTLPPGFQESTLYSDVTAPTAIEFAPNGRVFVAEKSGLIRTYASLSDSTPTQFADLRTKVHNFWDRGLLSIAVDPNFPTDPYLYVYYVHDAAIGGTAPRWGSPGQTSDPCPNPPGATTNGCVVSGRLSRFEVSGETMTGPEHVLIEDWCQQFPSHAGGGLEFGSDGNLYLAGGDGASFSGSTGDYGQFGDPRNPCGDPPGGVGGPMSPPTAEGGSLRSQDQRTTSDPLGLGGTVIRIDPGTGAGVPGNPLFSSTSANERRIFAYGLRNPFRLTVRPGIGDVWVGDVGAGAWEEIDRVQPPFASLRNFGWPCYEGGLNSSGNPASLRYFRFDQLNVNMCENLYADGSAAVPYWAYRQDVKIVPGEQCTENFGSSITGIAFAPSGGSFPPAYEGALFFADYSRNCIWSMRADAGGLPDPSTVEAFAQMAPTPVDLEFGPNGDLFYADIDTNSIRRIGVTGAPSNNPPTAVATATPQSGDLPLTVDFDGTGSSDPDTGDTLTYAWDLDDDGQLDDSTDPAPRFTYTTAGVYTVTLRVTDEAGGFDEDTVTIDAGSGPPAPAINTPVPGTTWRVGQNLAFSGSATDPDDGTLPGTALDWTVVMHHCSAPGECHQHTIQSFENRADGSFTAPDHEYPSHLELRLTATDSEGNTATVSRQLDPQTVVLTATSDPPGLDVSIGPASGTAPVSTQVIVGSQNTITAPASQQKDNTSFVFSSWSDGQPQTHDVTAPAADTTYTARYAPLAPGTQTLVFNPTADARVDEANPSQNFGSETDLRTDAGSDPDEESYLRFAVQGLTGKVVSAKLGLAATSNTGNGPAVYPTSSSWSEGGITWQNKPASSGPALDDAGGIGFGDWVEWDVTGSVTGEGDVAYRLAQTVTDGVDFHSRESSLVNGRPELVLTVLNDAYARPKGASPLRVSLVPAYQPCTAANRTHGPPLAHPSCGPPAPASQFLTIGTPDANDRPAMSIGSLRLAVIGGNPATPENEADYLITHNLTDVRNQGDLSDYTGQLRLVLSARVTDKLSGSSATDAATVADLSFPVTVPCAASPSSDGSNCDLTTSANTVVPGAVTESKRAIWALDRVQVYDGGADGSSATTGDNTLFATQGVFVP